MSLTLLTSVIAIVAGLLVDHDGTGFPHSAPLLFLELPPLLPLVISCQLYPILTQQTLMRSAR